VPVPPAKSQPGAADKAEKSEKTADKAVDKTDKAEKADKPEKSDKAEKTTAKAAPEAARPAPKPVPVEKPAPKPAAPVPPAASEDAAKVSAAAKPNAGTFFIQITALADADKVTQVRQRLTDAGLSSYTEAVNVAKGKVTRVRAGPFKTRDEAEQARVKLEQLGFEGKVAAN